LNNPVNTVLLILVVVFLLVTAVSVTVTVTRENTLKDVAAAASTPVNTGETQWTRGALPSGYSQSSNSQLANQGATAGPDTTQPYTPGPVNAPATDYVAPNDNAQPSCHATITQGTSTPTGTGTQGYRAGTGGCCGGR
jgi:hypothetical protein